jgi:hypothetical protein
LAKNIETWWMLCYPLKNTSEPIITTLGPKSCTFQNSNEFWPNSPNLILFFSFLSSSFLLQLDQGGNLAGYSLYLSLILLALSSWTQRKGGA